MLDSEFTVTPPSPGEVLKVVCEIFGPTPDPNNPFNDRQLTARRKLATDMLVEVYGSAHPISKIILAFDSYKALFEPTQDQLHAWQESIQSSAEALSDYIGQDIL